MILLVRAVLAVVYTALAHLASARHDNLLAALAIGVLVALVLLAPLFGAGLGLDSIDALELALAISKRYGFQLKSDNEENRRVFASLRALSAHVEQHKAA